MTRAPGLALLAVFCAVAAGAACSRPVPEALQLDGNLLTVTNQTASDWSDVEIWLNTYYRATAKTIAAGGRFQVPLDAFVAGFGQRFDFRRAQITDLRLTAKRPDGERFEVRKQFQTGGLAGALGGRK